MANNPLLAPALSGEKRGHNQNSVVAAINIGLFTEVESFKTQVDAQIEALKALPKAEGVTEILMPGEPEHNILAERSQTGVPLPPGTVQRLRAAAARFSLPLPF
jgi:LDH2 family malate/lactate/ureidoglycolate dehydrogenase